MDLKFGNFLKIAKNANRAKLKFVNSNYFLKVGRKVNILLKKSLFIQNIDFLYKTILFDDIDRNFFQIVLTTIFQK